MIAFSDRPWRRTTAFAALLSLLVPVFALSTLPAQAAPQTTPARKGFSTKQKVVALAGAALLYYMYRKYQAKQKANAAAESNMSAGNGGTATTAAAHPQLFRSRNGGIYYRDAQGKAFWVTTPQRRMEIPQSEVQRYAPDYSRYQNKPLPPAPRGYQTRSFSDLDDTLMTSGSGNMSNSGGGNMSNSAPGPRR